MSALLELKKAVKKGYLLYGSPTPLNEIYPTILNQTLVSVATPILEIAVFQAVLGACKSGIHKYSSDPGRKNKILLDICPEKLNMLLVGNPKGYVYLLEPTGFDRVSNISYSSPDICYPAGCIEVQKDALSFLPTADQFQYSFLLNKDVLYAFN